MGLAQSSRLRYDDDLGPHLGASVGASLAPFHCGDAKEHHKRQCAVVGDSGEMQLADKRVGRVFALDDHVPAAGEGDHNGAPFASGLAHERREVWGVAGDERGMVREAALELGVVDHGHDEVERGILTWGMGA
jgi:hypothetical protein